MKYKSIQPITTFLKLKSPFTIDKSSEWGPGNIQEFLIGGFLKVNEDGKTISHGVQPNKDFSAPVGWEQVIGNTYKKLDIEADFVEPGPILVKTLDGQMQHENKFGGYICGNIGEVEDFWFVEKDKFEKLYEPY